MLWLVWNMEIWKYDEICVFQSYQGGFPLTICQGSWKQRIQCFPFSNVFSTYDMNLMWSFVIMWSASMLSNPFFNFFHLCFQGLLDTETSETSKPELAHRTGFRSCAACHVAQDGSTMQLLKVSHRVLQHSHATFVSDVIFHVLRGWTSIDPGHFGGSNPFVKQEIHHSRGASLIAPAPKRRDVACSSAGAVLYGHLIHINPRGMIFSTPQPLNVCD